MRELQITVKAEMGGYQVEAKIFEIGADGTASAKISSNTAVCSTYQQIPARIKALVTVAEEHMRPVKKEGAA